MRAVLLMLSCVLGGTVFAQVEIFRGNQDTSTYIAPEDTITKPPKFESGDEEFFRYIETHFNMQIAYQNIDINGEVTKFQFYIEKDGSLTDYRHLFGTNSLVSTEMEKIVSRMPKWNPGYLQGKKKRTLMVYDIKIRTVEGAIPPIEVTENAMSLQYTDKTNQIKWFMATGAVLVLLSLWIRSSL